MKVAHRVLYLTLLAFSSNLVTGNGFLPSDNIKLSSDETSWSAAFETTFNGNEVVQNYNSTDGTPILQCYFNYEYRKLEIYLQVGIGIRDCKDISLEDFENYFKHHSWQRFKRRLIRDVLRCKARSYDEEHYIDCLTDVVSKSLNDIKHEYGHKKRETRKCIRYEFENMVFDLYENNRELDDCLFNQTYPGFNTTANPWYPWDNTTQTPPKFNTTWNPWANSTFNPWENSTARPPVFNTTSNPWFNQTWNPWWNTTHRPTTWRPWWNTTEHPWQSSTDEPPKFNTTTNPWFNQTSNPWWSTTHRPLYTTKRPWNTTHRPWYTTQRPWNTTHNPWDTTRRPWDTTRRPWNSTHKPWSTTRRPWTTTRRPGNTTHRPWNTTPRPWNTTRLPTTLNPWQNSTQTSPNFNTTRNPSGHTTLSPWQNATSYPLQNSTRSNYQKSTEATSKPNQWNPFWNPWFNARRTSYLERKEKSEKIAEDSTN